MPIFKAAHERDFTIVNNSVILDSRLSFKARGILLYLLSKPDEWHVILKDIANHSPDGIKSARAAFDELLQFGYVKKEQAREQNGTFGKFDYCVYEIPFSDNGVTVAPLSHYRQAAEPLAAEPLADNGALVIQKIQKTDLSYTQGEKESARARAEGEPPSGFHESIDLIVEHLNKVFYLRCPYEKAGLWYSAIAVNTVAIMNKRFAESYEPENFIHLIDLFNASYKYSNQSNAIRDFHPVRLFTIKNFKRFGIWVSRS